jgi:hypothetical protein
MFAPRLDILPPPQRRLWPELSDTPSEFVLYGGTAVALRLGHRESVDFDFFAFDAVQMETLALDVRYLAGADVIQSAPRTLTFRVERGGGTVRVSYFEGLLLGQVAPPEVLKEPEVRVAALIDLAATKVAVVTQRAEPRDYLDLHALLRSGISLSEMLAAGRAVYGRQFSPVVSLKAIAYHEDPALAGIPDAIKRDLADAAKTTSPHRLPSLKPFRPSRLDR